MNTSKHLRARTVVAIASLCAAAAQAAPAYHLVDLGAGSEAAAINRAGVIAGALNGNEGFYADSTWKTRHLAHGAGEALGIDNHGNTVGVITSRGGTETAMYWDKGGHGTAIPLPDYPFGAADAITPDGSLVAGAGERTATPSAYCFTWTPGAAAVNVLDIDECSLNGINGKGQLVGEALVSGGSSEHGFIYTNGQVTDIGVLPSAGVYGQSAAISINDKGHVAGWSNVGTATQPHAVFWNGHRLLDLGTLGGTYSYGAAINNHDEIAGTSTDAANKNHLFLYANGQMQLLDAMVDDLTGWVDLGFPSTITDDGVIIGNGYYGDETSAAQHAYMLVPIAQ